MLCLLVSALTVYKSPCRGLFSAMFFTFLCFSLVIMLSKMFLQHSEVLSSVPKHKKAVVCFTKNIHVLGKLSSGTSCSAIGYEFDVNKSAIYTR